MKRVNFFLIAAFVAASAMLFVSCDKEEDELDNPTIAITAKVGGSPYTIANDKIIGEQGLMVELNVVYTMGKNRLDSVQLKTRFGNSTTDLVALSEKLSFSEGRNEYPFSYLTNIGNDKELLTIEAVDVRGRITKKSLTIEVEEEEEIVIDPEKGYCYTVSPVFQLGAQGHTTLGSFYSVQQGKVYTIRAAMDASSIVDFAYFNSGGAVIYSPKAASDEKLTYSSSNSSLNPEKWTGKKNSTKFVIVPDVSAATDPDPNDWREDWWDDAMGALTDGPADKTATLSTNSVVAFKTEGGAEGAFIVTAIQAGTIGSLSLKLIARHE